MADPIGWPNQYALSPPSRLPTSVVKGNANYIFAFSASLSARGSPMIQVWLDELLGEGAGGSGKTFVFE